MLRDSLGAVDAHYEVALDGMQEELSGSKPKILASSATLTGYEKQVSVLYRRTARVFPQPPPQDGNGFWTAASSQLMRRYIALAPRQLSVAEFIQATARVGRRWPALVVVVPKMTRERDASVIVTLLNSFRTAIDSSKRYRLLAKAAEFLSALWLTAPFIGLLRYATKSTAPSSKTRVCSTKSAPWRIRKTISGSPGTPDAQDLPQSRRDTNGHHQAVTKAKD